LLHRGATRLIRVCETDHTVMNTRSLWGH